MPFIPLVERHTVLIWKSWALEKEMVFFFTRKWTNIWGTMLVEKQRKRQQKADVPERQRVTRGWVGTRIHSHRLLSLNIVLLLMKPWAGY